MSIKKEVLYKIFDCEFNLSEFKNDDRVKRVIKTIDLALEKSKAEVLKIIEKHPIDELCQCGHSKKCHGMTGIDVNGGVCNQCQCQLYTWKEFIFDDELKKKVQSK